MQALVQTPPVLNYDPLTLTHIASRLRRRLAFIIFVAIAGALLGFLIRPAQYESKAIFFIAAEAAELGNTPISVVQEARRAAKPALESAPSLDAGVIAAKNNGVVLTSKQVASHLKVTVLNDTRLIEVSFTHENPTIAVAVTNAIVNRYAASSPFANILATPTVPTRPHASVSLIATGTIAGGLAGWIISSSARR